MVDAAVRLILGVARLGEADLAGWWNSHGLGPVGRFVLPRTFKRTWQPAALELDILSATRRHNETLASRRTALHLFSDELPIRRWASAWLAEQKTIKERSGLFSELESWNFGEAQSKLAEWAGDVPTGEEIGNGLLLGELSANEVEDETTMPSIARILAASYVSLGPSFRAPYFDLRG
jgi:hypothetical protein